MANKEATARIKINKLLEAAGWRLNFLYWLLKTLNLPELRGGAGIPGLNRTDVYETHQIPLPPLKVQKEIVAEIEGYQKVINGARAVLDHYRPHIPIHPDWPMVELGDKLSFVSSGATPKGGKETYLSEGVLFIRSQNILCGSHDFSDAAFISEETHNEMSRSQVKYGDVFLNITGASIGRSAWMDLDIPANVNQHVAILRSPSRTGTKSRLPLTLSEFGHWSKSDSIFSSGSIARGTQLLPNPATQNPPPTPRHAASHCRRDRSRANAGRRQPRTDFPLRAKYPGHPYPRVGGRNK